MAKSYTKQKKAAVMAALLEGQSVSSVARQYKIPKGTVSGWKQKALNTGVEGVATQKKEEIGDLLLVYLRQNLQTLTAQSEHCQNKKWLERQSAESLAVLHGVLADKTVRLLEAISAADDDD